MATEINKKYSQTRSDFSDYIKFEDDNVELREVAKRAFINNSEWFPSYDYPKNKLFDQETAELKQSIYSAVIELEAAKSSPEVDQAEIDLYTSFHEARLKRIMLVEAARNLDYSISSADSEVSRQAFSDINEATYGPFDRDCFLGMLDTERAVVVNFQSINDRASDIKKYLTAFFEKINTADCFEQDIISSENLAKLHEYISNRYIQVLNEVPDTTEDVYYDAEHCKVIMNRALASGRLRDWRVEIDSAKSNPSTNSTDCKIYLPTNTRRNAAELRRLIIHEQEVHARRAENAKRHNILPIQLGTANYFDVEEGLGVILECALEGNLDNPSFHRARDRYLTAGLALGADGQPRDAREVYEVMWRLLALRKSLDGNVSLELVEKSKDEAYRHIENAYRGTQFWMKGIIYTKLKVYYEGLVKNAKYMSDKIDNLDQAFAQAMLGKYDHTDPNETRLVLTILAKSVNISKPE